VTDKATFLASFPCIQSAIKVYGDEQGMRVQLDIPESEMAEALKLLQWRGVVLRIVIEPAEDCRPGADKRRELHI
jgi:hypothetical protein